MTRRKINRITQICLLLGFGAALVIFLLAAPEVIDPLTGDPLNNKKYVHELALYGGKANVLSAEFMDDFAGLWHGRNLAFTVAVLTVGIVLLFRFVATHPHNLVPDRPEPGAPTGPTDAG
jgi:hypothetical protein